MAFDRRRLAWHPLAVAATVAMTAVLPTRGAYAAEPTAAEKETARSLMDKGMAQRAQGDHAGAQRSFQTADELMHVPTTGLEVARTEAQLGLLTEARDRLLQIARSASRPNEPHVFAEARSKAATLADELAQRIPSLTIEVKGATPSTRVTLDDAPLPVVLLGMPRKLNPGRHVVVAHDGESVRRAEKQIAEGEVASLVVDLSPAAAPAANVPPASLAPLAAPDTSPKDDERHSLSPITWVGFGAGAAGLVVGTVTGLVSLSRTSSLKEKCPENRCPPGIVEGDDYAGARSMATISTVGFVVAGAGVAAGIVGILLSKPHVKEASPSRQLGVGGPTGLAGLTFRQVF